MSNLNECGFSKYYITKNGDLYRAFKKYSKKLKGSIKRYGYIRYTLVGDDGKLKYKKAYELVALAYLGDKPKDLEICHNDGNRDNNHIENLRYDTHSNNMFDMYKHGRNASGERNGNSKITSKQTKEIQNKYNTGKYSYRKLAFEYGFKSIKSIYDIIKGNQWKNMQLPRNYSDPSYIRWRARVYKRDGYQCKMCGQKGNIQAHHLKRWADFPELRYVTSNGITLCVLCHDRVTGYEEEYEEMLRNLIQQGNYKNKYDKHDINRMLDDL